MRLDVTKHNYRLRQSSRTARSISNTGRVVLYASSHSLCRRVVRQSTSALSTMNTIIILLAVVAGLDAYKYLLINPLFGQSHVNYLSKIADVLTDAGHDVTVVAPLLDSLLKGKAGLKSTKKLIETPVDPRVEKMMIASRTGMMKNLWTMPTDPRSLMAMGYNMSVMFASACDGLISDDKLLDRLRAEKFDCGIAEPFSICGLGLIEALGIPSRIGASSTVQLDVLSSAIGEPVLPSYVPAMTTSSGPAMNILQRLGNAFGGYMGANFFAATFEAEIAVFRKKFGAGFKSYQEILADCSYIFTNANPYLNYPRPTIHKTIEIGGITVDLGKKAALGLDEQWDKVLNERKHTVFVSFGSVAKSKDMPEEYKKTLLSVFAELSDVTFIWKYEEPTTIADHLPNVHISPWLPQNALLADSRLSIFITHGGLGSTTEVAHLGRPAIMIPLFAEQPRNAAMLAAKGGALVLEKNDLTNKKKIVETIRTILNDPSYAKNASLLADMLTNVPMDPKQLLIRHAEFAARFGALPQLDPYARHLGFLSYFLVDCALLVVGVIVLIILLIALTIRKIYRVLCSPKKQHKD